MRSCTLTRAARMRAAGRAVLVVSLLFPLACDDAPPLAPPPDDPGTDPGDEVAFVISIAPAVDTLDAIGASHDLTATVTDLQGEPVPDAEIAWTSLDPEVVTVSPSGRTTAVAVGAALITAAAGAAVDTARLVVRQVVVAVAVAPAEAELDVGDTLRLTATAADANGYAIADAAFAWSTSDASRVTVDADGLARAVSGGSAQITATAGAAAATATIVVRQPDAPSTWVYPGDDLKKKVADHPSGTTFTLKPGVHRLHAITPKNGNSFIGEPGAVLSGAKLLTEFTREGGLWVSSGHPERGSRNGRCLDRKDGTTDPCMYPEDLYIDDQLVQQVRTRSEVGPGRWYFDYDAQKIYFADDPTGRRVELAVAPHAFTGDASDVTIRGLVIEKYANPAQYGAIHGRRTSSSLSSGWVIEDNVIRWNHGGGVRTGDRMVVRNNRIVENGQLGMSGGGTDVLIEGNEIAYNNIQGFSWGWEAGGTKFVRARNMVIRNNHVHHNRGPGLWSDIDNIYTLYEDNLVEDNENMGIFHEISYDAVIRNNIVRRNGFAYTAWMWGAGILVAASPNVEVYGNQVLDNAGGIAGVQQNRGSGAHGPYLVSNLYVHDNVVRMSTGRTGVVEDTGDTSIFTSRNNRFRRNTYHLSGTARYFAWNKSTLTDAEWRGYGHDVDGTFNR